MKSWKTTISGLLTLAGGIYLIITGHPVEGAVIIPVGLGLLAAKDSTVTGVGSDSKTLNELKKEE